MEPEIYLYVATIGLLSIIVLCGIFRTKARGFGRFSTSLILLVLVLSFAALFLVVGKIDGGIFANVAFAVAGYAGGLISQARQPSDTNTKTIGDEE